MRRAEYHRRQQDCGGRARSATQAEQQVSARAGVQPQPAIGQRKSFKDA